MCVRENRKYLKEKVIQIYEPALGRLPKEDPITSAQKYSNHKKAA